MATAPGDRRSPQLAVRQLASVLSLDRANQMRTFAPQWDPSDRETATMAEDLRGVDRACAQSAKERAGLAGAEVSWVVIE